MTDFAEEGNVLRMQEEEAQAVSSIYMQDFYYIDDTINKFEVCDLAVFCKIKRFFILSFFFFFY
jgi:hypothetical protein